MRKYELPFEEVQVGSDESEIIKEILEFAEYHPKFDSTFVQSVEKHMWKEGFISFYQYQGLLNIYYGFQMDKPYEKNKAEIEKIGAK